MDTITNITKTSAYTQVHDSTGGQGWKWIYRQVSKYFSRKNKKTICSGDRFLYNNGQIRLYFDNHPRNTGCILRKVNPVHEKNKW